MACAYSLPKKIQQQLWLHWHPAMHISIWCKHTDPATTDDQREEHKKLHFALLSSKNGPDLQHVPAFHLCSTFHQCSAFLLCCLYCTLAVPHIPVVQCILTLHCTAAVHSNFALLLCTLNLHCTAVYPDSSLHCCCAFCLCIALLLCIAGLF